MNRVNITTKQFHDVYGQDFTNGRALEFYELPEEVVVLYREAMRYINNVVNSVIEQHAVEIAGELRLFMKEKLDNFSRPVFVVQFDTTIGNIFTLEFPILF